MMKREISRSFTLTKDEDKLLRKLVREYEDKEDTRISLSEYIRRFILLPYMNGNAPSLPDSKPDTEQHIEPGIQGKYAHLLDDV